MRQHLRIATRWTRRCPAILLLIVWKIVDISFLGNIRRVDMKCRVVIVFRVSDLIGTRRNVRYVNEEIHYDDVEFAFEFWIQLETPMSRVPPIRRPSITSPGSLQGPLTTGDSGHTSGNSCACSFHRELRSVHQDRHTAQGPGSPYIWQRTRCSNRGVRWWRPRKWLK